MIINNDSNKKTLKQWIALGRIPNENACGETMWTNGYRQFTAVYYDVSETHDASMDEIKKAKEPFLAAKREKERLRKRISRAKQRKEILLEKAKDAPLCPCINPSGIVIYDLETTGVDPKEDEILQFYACDGAGNTLLETYVKPYVKESWPGAMENNKITPRTVQNAPYLHEVYPTIKSIVLSAKKLVTYNGYFNALFLQEIGIDTLLIPECDVMFEFAAIYNEWDYLRNTYSWKPLNTCATYYNYELKNQNIKEKALATLYCYNKIHET